MYKFLLSLFGFFCFLPSYTNAQSADNKAVTKKKDIAMVYIMSDASLTRFHTPLDNRTNNFNSLFGITLGFGTAFDSFLNGVIQVSGHEIEEPVDPTLDFVSETQIWYFMSGLRLQDPSQSIFWDLLAGLNRHIYNFEGVDLGSVGTINSFAMSTSLNIPIMRVKGTPVIASIGVKKAFNKNTEHVNYFLGLKIAQIFIR